ncbi:MAG: protein phosphatase 2C domain-containing protein [Prevotella sp.]|nr:protein phosphatase 2C domain-containing protein [Prevotella sp.]MCM1074155.1 protein phosphatase 2C domain-containing protein [Ruminococcus sp.]
MKYKIQVYSIWEYGARKDADGNPHQEDNMYPAFGQATPQDRTFILCDGMGGHGSGEVASAAVCEAMSRSIINNGHDAEGIFTDEDLKNAIETAYEELDRRDTREAKKMGTTMTFLKLHSKGATIAHIGDSRVYQIRPGKDEHDTRILFQTSDHSLVNDLVKIGELTPEEARKSPQKNVITRSMMPGADGRHKADVQHITDIHPGDFFYMCSDGMLEQEDMDNGTVLRRIFSNQMDSDGRRVEILRGATNANRDNHTAFIIHILEVIDPLREAVSESAKSLSERSPIDDQPGKPALRTNSQKYIPISAAACAILIVLCVWGFFQKKTDNTPGEPIENSEAKPVRQDKIPMVKHQTHKETDNQQSQKDTVEIPPAETSETRQGTVNQKQTPDADVNNTNDDTPFENINSILGV